jgi:NAD(P)-dependent dehydrogenase (short-subunit alcohol dehydrogenase family)
VQETAMSDARSAIVTGAGQGIGYRFAQELGARGFSLILADIIGAEEAAARLREAGVSCHGIQTDVSSEADVRAMAAACINRFGGIDVLVNNAGLMSTLRPFEEISSDEWMKVMGVNTLGPFLCAKAVVPNMREKGRGRIVNLASTVALKGVPGWLHYVSSKGAVIAFTRALAREVGQAGITVPGLIHDLPATSWAHDDGSELLFVSDAFAFSHYREDECTLLTDELPSKPTVEDTRMVLDLALSWVRFSDNRGLMESVRRMLRENKTRMICPAHGNVITDVAELTVLMERAFLANGIKRKNIFGHPRP